MFFFAGVDVWAKSKVDNCVIRPLIRSENNWVLMLMMAGYGSDEENICDDTKYM